MIDLHCHLLGGTDDGPPNISDAVELALESSRQGVTTAVTTPHFNHRYPTTVEAAQAAAGELRAELQKAGCELELFLGSEINLASLPSLSTDELKARTLGNGNCVLLEPPFHEDPGNLEFAVNDLLVDGFEVLIAHPERSLALVRSQELLQRLVRRGALCSVTASSLRGRHGRSTQAVALEMCSKGLIHNVSSDCHDLRSRPPGLGVGDSWPQGLPERDELEETARRLLALDGSGEPSEAAGDSTALASKLQS